jgi:CO dehydrogenase/acetyl-CoA synthase gamma subunit (corrinoid Fe-S protein)
LRHYIVLPVLRAAAMWFTPRVELLGLEGRLTPIARVFDEDPVDFTTSGNTSLRYDTTEGRFIQNWKTPKTPGCYLVKVTGDGLLINARFKLR